MDFYLIMGLGMVAQGLFSARFIIQLTRSELAGKVVSPSLFWKLSLLASFLLIIYGFLRNDIVIIGGQFVSYFIYIRNLQLKEEWQKLSRFFRIGFSLLPMMLLLWLLVFSFPSFNALLNNPDIPMLLLTYGTVGQVVFTLRFVVQWAHSEKRKESMFPSSFWILSLAGALLIIGYAVLRKDAVLFIGQFFGILVYSRNLYLHFLPRPKMKTQTLSIVESARKHRMVLLLTLVSFALLFNLNDWSVRESTEARYAQVSKEMLESGDYMHPRLMGIRHYHKPPLTYWVTALSFKIFGVNGLGARFFLQVAIVLQVLTVFGIAGILLGNRRLAFYAALLYFSLPGVVMSGRALTTDVYLTSFVLLAVYSWLKYAVRNGNGWLLLFYLALGLGFFTKGPVVFIFPAFILTGAWLSGFRPTGRPLLHVSGVLLMLIVGLSWFVYLFALDHRFLDYFLVRHTLERFTTDVFLRSEPWWYYLAIVPALSLPWGILLITRFFRFRELRKHGGLIFLLWVAGPIVFFSLSQSKMLLYVLPVYAGIATGAVWAWSRMDLRRQKRWGTAQLILHIAMITGVILFPLVEPAITYSSKVYFFMVITASAIISLRFTPIGAQEQPVLAAAILMFGLTLVSPYILAGNPEKVKDTRRVVAFIEQELSDTEDILIFDRRLPSIPFQTDKNVISLYYGDHTLNREVQFEPDDRWKKNLVNLREEPDRLGELIGPNTVMLVGSRRGLPEVFSGPASRYQHIVTIDGWHIYH
jgi:4-amino-4-deoxy-L-arabinose transferase-like glycosyltransferase/lipid-A-disaccharide synthase-like uncharacterized protein